MALEYLFPSPIQISNIDDEVLNKNLLKDVLAFNSKNKNTPPGSWNANLSTSFSSDFNMFELKSFSSLKPHIYDQATQYCRELGYDVASNPLIITDIWYNIYRPGDWQEAHIHADNIISGIYYVSAPEGCGELVMHSPYAENMLTAPISEPNPLNAVSARFYPKTGQMILFKSNLRHSVMVNKNKKKRISIAFNLTM